uniref:Beta-ketoacyl-[acyl-carrier-protein] synthase III n=1 Tax=Scinaia undulata TaxID=1884664 RepID=A0A1G4NX94_9FLOR|nr:Beta-ketoacyl-acyl carrier protein synthase III [Scinaia undulata]SCW23313.1 Beta-ketoacyl-acyl carrier protein synthase III [Scinaia undulata]
MKLSTLAGSHIVATGSAVPDIKISNEILSRIVDTSDTWISTRTGIKERRLLPKHKSIIDLAADAANEALDNALLSPSDIDLIILATSSQNDLFGSASQLQAAIKAKNAMGFDITAACSGFLIGLITASQFIQTGSYKNILIVGADILSRWVDWSDRSTCILFGDGAGAAIIQNTQKNDILGFHLNTNGAEAKQLSISYQYSPEATSSSYRQQSPPSGRYNYLRMNGKEVYKFAVSNVPKSIKKSLNELQISTDDISWLLLHQANQRILEAVADKLSIPTEKVVSNIAQYGNTSAASIPIALNECFEKGKICNGDIIVIAGFGAGLTWGTLVVQWNAIESN